MAAWEVTDQDIDSSSSTIVFADDEETAKGLGAYELATELECVCAVRSPDHDQFAALGYVPLQFLYDIYWSFSCRCCDRVVSLADDEDEDGNPLEPVFEEKRLFCSFRCQLSFYSALQKQTEDRERAKRLLLERFPGILISSCHGGNLFPIVVCFRFPGGKESAQWASDKPGIVDVATCDVAAWNALY